MTSSSGTAIHKLYRLLDKQCRSAGPSRRLDCPCLHWAKVTYEMVPTFFYKSLCLPRIRPRKMTSLQIPQFVYSHHANLHASLWNHLQSGGLFTKQHYFKPPISRVQLVAPFKQPVCHLQQKMQNKHNPDNVEIRKCSGEWQPIIEFTSPLSPHKTANVSLFQAEGSKCRDLFSFSGHFVSFSVTASGRKNTVAIEQNVQSFVWRGILMQFELRDGDI